MAEDKPKKMRKLKKEKETVRQKAEKASGGAPKERRIYKTAGKVAKPFKAAHRIGKKEYYIPLPENRIGTFLNKRRRFMPRYFREAYGELRQVTWPSRRETWKLTSAVFLFAIVFSVVISLTDYGLDKVFRKILLQ